MGSKKKTPKKTTPKKLKKKITKSPKKSIPKRKKTKIKLPTKPSSSTSSRTKKKTGKIIKYDSSKQYKLRRPKSAWMLFNAFKIAQLKSQYPDEQLGARTKRSSKIWQSMNDDAKSEWNEKALAERLKWEKVKKAFSVHGDYSKVPGRWLAVDKKTKKSDEKKEKSASPKKKKVTSPKKKTAKKKIVKKKKKSKKVDSSSDSDSDSSSSSESSSFGGVDSNGSDSSSSSSDSESAKKKVTKKKKKRRVPKKIKAKKVTIKAPNVTTRSAAKNDPNFNHSEPISSFRRIKAKPLSVKSGNMSKQTVATDKNKNAMPLSKKEELMLMQSQPQGSMSDDDDSSMSSIDGIRGMKVGGIPRTPDKNKQSKAKMIVDLPATLPEDDESSDESNHFGV